MFGEHTPSDVELLGRQAIEAALALHKHLGPGLLESVYEICLAHELSQRGIEVIRQKSLPVFYRTLRLDGAYRIDLLLDCKVIIEVKAVDAILPVHSAQLLTYLKLSGCRLGFVMNFNVVLFKHGLRRLVL
jgi:GxxExxY protein